MVNWVEMRMFLVERGAASAAHTGRTLLSHLENTRGILDRWGAAVDTQVVGLFHSVYSTPYYKGQIFSTFEREKLRKLIGDENEYLVYSYANSTGERILSRFILNKKDEAAKILAVVFLANIFEQWNYVDVNLQKYILEKFSDKMKRAVMNFSYLCEIDLSMIMKDQLIK